MKYLWNLLPEKFIEDKPFGTDGIFVIDSNVTVDEVAIKDGYVHYRSTYGVMISNIIDYKHIQCVIYPNVNYPKDECRIPLSLINETEESISLKTVSEVRDLIQNYDALVSDLRDAGYVLTPYDNTFDSVFRVITGNEIFELPADMTDNFIICFLNNIKSIDENNCSIEQIPKISSDMIMRARELESPVALQFGFDHFIARIPLTEDQSTARSIFNWVSPYNFTKSCVADANICYQLFSYYIGKLLIKYHNDDDLEYLTRYLRPLISTPIMYFNAADLRGCSSVVGFSDSGDIDYVDTGYFEIESESSFDIRSNSKFNDILASLDVYFLNFDIFGSDKVRLYYCFYENFVAFRSYAIDHDTKFGRDTFNVSGEMAYMRESVATKILRNDQGNSND